MRLPAIALLVLSFALPGSAGQKKPLYSNLTPRPGLVATLAAPPSVVAAQPCQNWAWAAGMEAMLRARGLVIPQEEWVVRAYGGSVCRELGGLAELERAVNRNFATADGQHVELTLRFTPPAGLNAVALLSAMKTDRPVIVLLDGRAMLLTGMTYDEFIASNGAAFYEIRELKLQDPLQPLQSAARQVVFNRANDDAARITGVFDVEVRRRDPGRF